MRKYTHININHMMFHTISYPLKYAPEKIIIECSSVDSMLVLRRCRIVSVFHTVFGYETMQNYKDERERRY